MTLEDMTDEEKHVLASLMRLLVRADNQFSADESRAMHEVAEELGKDEFWGLVEVAMMRDDQDDDHVRANAAEVTRQEVRDVIYGSLFTIAIEDAMLAKQSELLEWLGKEWSIEAKPV